MRVLKPRKISYKHMKIWWDRLAKEDIKVRESVLTRLGLPLHLATFDFSFVWGAIQAKNYQQ